MTLNELSALIKKRRSIFPKVFTGEKIENDIVWNLLDNANQAPSHKHTEPWRFKVFACEAKKQLGDFFQHTYKEYQPSEKYDEKKYKKLGFKIEKSSHVIAICMQRNPENSVPEWEEIAATACAIQNLYLSVTASGLGGYWSSPKLQMDHFGKYVSLAEGERCLGFFYLGVPMEGMDLKVEKGDIKGRVDWNE